MREIVQTCVRVRVHERETEREKESEKETLIASFLTPRCNSRSRLSSITTTRKKGLILAAISL